MSHQSQPNMPPGPYYLTINNIQSFSIAQQTGEGLGASFRPIPPNDRHFAPIAIAVNIGLEMLETLDGQRALGTLGEAVISEWKKNPNYNFPGSIHQMPTYVRHFLERVRSDFPRVVIAPMDRMILAVTNRGDWGGDLGNFDPKRGASILLNSERVEGMKRAYDYCQAARSNTAEKRKYMERYQTFLFMFACSILHELAHVFVGYISRGNTRNTPEAVSHLDYGPVIDNVQYGESGRWLENMLYGGSVDFYNDPDGSENQAGIGFISDGRDRSYKIDPDFILELIRNRDYQFPFPVSSNHITKAQRRELGMQTLSSTRPDGRPLPNMRAMQSMPGVYVLSTMSKHTVEIKWLQPGASGSNVEWDMRVIPVGIPSTR